MVTNRTLQLVEEGRRLSEIPALSFMALLSMPRARLLDLGGQLNILPKPCQALLTGDNLFLETAKITNMYKQVSGDLAGWMGRDMDVIWDCFQKNASNPTEWSDQMQYLPAAEPLIRGLGECLVSNQYGIEYTLASGSRAVPVDAGLSCQDVLIVPTGARDPKKVVSAQAWIKPIIDSPLLVFPDRLTARDVAVLGDLTRTFADVVCSLREPMRLVIYAGYELNYYPILDRTEPFELLLNHLGSAGTPLDHLGASGLVIWADGKETRGSALVRRNSSNGGPTNGDMVRFLRGVLEERFLSGVKQVQAQAREAAALMVSHLKERHEENWDRRAEITLTMLAEIIYGTWVESLLLLWRKNFNNPAASYLR